MGKRYLALATRSYTTCNVLNTSIEAQQCDHPVLVPEALAMGSVQQPC